MGYVISEELYNKMCRMLEETDRWAEGKASSEKGGDYIYYYDLCLTIKDEAKVV